MPNSEDSLLEQMREGRETYEAIYLKFINQREYHKKYAFCFYEGEDGKYYDPRIRAQFNKKIITYTVGNKKNILKLLKKITSENLYDDICTMFFIDRDYDDSMNGSNENLFETPSYSIENFYVQRECLLKILQSEFGLNEIDADCKKCLQDFDEREKEFNNCILEFNSLLYLQRKKSISSSNCVFASIKTSKMIKIDIKKVEKTKQYNKIIQEIINKLKVSEHEIKEAKNKLTKKGLFSLNFRGKNQLDFFVEFIKSLKEINNEGGYFSTKYNNVHINLTSNRLSELSQYAITPSVLEEFLERHKNKFEDANKIIKKGSNNHN